MLLQSVSMSSQKIRFVTVVRCHKQDTSLAKHHRRNGHRCRSGRSKIWTSRRRRCSSGKGSQLGLQALALMVAAVASATDTHMLTSTRRVLPVSILKGKADAIAFIPVEHVLNLWTSSEKVSHGPHFACWWSLTFLLFLRFALSVSLRRRRRCRR